MTFCKNTKEGKFSKCVQCSNTPHPNTYNVIRRTVSVTHTNARTYKHTQHANTHTHRAAAEEAAAVSHVSRVFCMIVSTLQKRRWIVRIWWVAAHVGQKRGNKRNCKNWTKEKKIIHAILSPYWIYSCIYRVTPEYSAGERYNNNLYADDWDCDISQNFGMTSCVVCFFHSYF